MATPSRSRRRHIWRWKPFSLKGADGGGDSAGGAGGGDGIGDGGGVDGGGGGDGDGGGVGGVGGEAKGPAGGGGGGGELGGSGDGGGETGDGDGEVTGSAGDGGGETGGGGGGDSGGGDEDSPLALSPTASPVCWQWQHFSEVGLNNPTSPLLSHSIPPLYQPGGLIINSAHVWLCLLYTSPSPRDRQKSRMPSSA